MKRILVLFLGCCLLAFLAPARGQEADMDLLAVTIDGAVYRLGESTAEDLLANGWACQREAEDVYAFYSPENESYFYVRTAGGAPSDVLVEIDLLWADGIPVRYCGFPADTESLTGDDISLWDWLTDTFQAETDEEGTLIARVPLSAGGSLQIATKDIRVRLSLTP